MGLEFIHGSMLEKGRIGKKIKDMKGMEYKPLKGRELFIIFSSLLMVVLVSTSLLMDAKIGKVTRI